MKLQQVNGCTHADDPLKLKMTPKVNYLGVTMTPENFFEGKTLVFLRQKREKLATRKYSILRYSC